MILLRYGAIFVLTIVLLSSCRVNYLFTGGDVGDARTITVEQFEGRAPLSTPNSVRIFSEELRTLLLAQTPLKLKQEEGDVQYSGAITGFDVQPVSIQANETAALNRLTITVSVTYINTLDTKLNAEFSVSRFADYDSSQDLISVEQQLVADISKQLAQDIFERTLGNW
ncbi:MAG: LptE family protein [Flavobacteriales bacterium]|nr:LptE family protein [Flavobacteriales bacterium]